MLKKILSSILMVMVCSGISYAAHPLITDDTGTQGKGKFQVETNFEQGYEEGKGVRVDGSQFQLAITYGVVDSVDIVCTLPFLYVRTKDNGIKSTNGGISDVSLEAKWRFYESDSLSFAIKPGLSFPSGDKNEGLGADEVGGSLFFIATKEVDPLAFHLNVGYMRNENDLEEGRDVWHISLATEWKALSWMRVVANFGAEGGRDLESNTPVPFVLGGLIFPVADYIDLDVGLKGNFSESTQGCSLLAGATFRF